MLARSRGVPMVVGLGAAAIEIDGTALLDAEHGGIVLSPTAADIESFPHARRMNTARAAPAPTISCFGLPRPRQARRSACRSTSPIPSDVDAIDIAACDGVGLMRTEFLFGKASGLPDEETQYAAYRKVLEWAGGKPVTIRTVDAGGDKPVPGFTVEESNPFLGLRGIRLSLARPEIFRVQIRALLRAAPHGNLKVMFPMIAVVDEYDRAAALFEEEARNLARQGVPHKMPPLGIMVEVPSVAIAPEAFAKVAFFSIGSNDLTQYVMAAARDNAVGRASQHRAASRRAAADRVGRLIRPRARHSGQPVRRRGRRSRLHSGAARSRAARSFGRAGAACHGQGGNRRRRGLASDGRGRRFPFPGMPRRRSAPTRPCSRR